MSEQELNELPGSKPLSSGLCADCIHRKDRDEHGGYFCKLVAVWCERYEREEKKVDTHLLNG